MFLFQKVVLTLTKVSIIIPVFNGEKTIRRAIDSCISQTYKDIEILVIDNMSEDSTFSVISKYNDKRIRIFSIPQKGRSKARNYGIRNAEGKYLLFLDADDEISEDRIEKGVEFLEKNGQYFAHANAILYINELNKTCRVHEINYSPKKFQLNNVFPINSVLLKNQILSNFSEELELNEDWLFFVENLYQKNIYIDNNNLGGKVYITGNNTMSDVYGMISAKLDLKIRYRKSYFKSYRSLLDNRKLFVYVCVLCNFKINQKYRVYFPVIYRLIAYLSDKEFFASMVKNAITKKIRNSYDY